MNGWVNAVEAPAEWGGRRVWQWSPNEGPFITTMPRDYSREVHHCGSVWFKLLTIPSHPSVRDQHEFHLRMERK